VPQEPASPATAPAPLPEPSADQPPESAPGPYIVFFDWDRDEISPQAAAILDNAARMYRYAGVPRVIVSGSADTQAADRALAARRIEAARRYLILRDVPISVRAASGEWVQIVDEAASRGSPESAPPRPRPHRRPPSARPRAGVPTPIAGDAASANPQLGAIRSWLTPTGTITRAAMEAMIHECVRLDGRMTADCQGAVRAGEGGFRSAPEEARTEFSFLLNTCLGARPGEDCAQVVALNREFRALPRGRLEPRPLTMLEGERSLFTARIVDDPRIQGRPGLPIEDSSAGAEDAAGANSSQSVIPFSRRMCFNLTAVNPEDFRIERIGDRCMNVRDGGGAVKYDPQWYVTPLRSGRRELLLVTELYVNNLRRDFRHQPYPLPITVTPKPSLWDRVDATIRRITGTVNLAVGLAEALGSLFVAIAGWSLWSWFRKRSRRRRAKAPAGARPDANSAE
jgi:hypothetical protein